MDRNGFYTTPRAAISNSPPSYGALGYGYIRHYEKLIEVAVIKIELRLRGIEYLCTCEEYFGWQSKRNVLLFEEYP